MSKVRIPDRVMEYLLGSQAAYTPEADPEMAAVIARLREVKMRKDRSRTVEISDPAEQEALREYVGAMLAGANDTVGYGDEGLDALADLNSGRAVLRALERLQEGR